ncbi:hypothetical protein AB0T91_09380 [Escherichia coli]
MAKRITIHQNEVSNVVRKAGRIGSGGRGGARGGVAGDCYGAGGGGAYDAAMSGNSYNGGQGKAGIVYIEEYS